MQIVNEKWYTFYRWVSISGGLLVPIIAIVGTLMPRISGSYSFFHITYFSVIMSLVQVAYGILLYKIVAEKKGYSESMLILAILQALTIFSVSQSTGMMLSPFMIWWLFAAIMCGIFGIYGSAGTAFLTLIYFMQSTTNTSGSTKYSLPAVISLLVILATVALSQLYWRTRYLSQDSLQLVNLQGQLKVNQQQSEILVKSLTDGVVLIDIKGAITLINPSASKLLNWEVADAIGADYRSVLHIKSENGEEVTDEENPIFHTINSRKPREGIFQIANSSNDSLVVSLSTSPVLINKTNELRGIVVVLRDISIARRTEKQRADFISTASHEMRTPVAAIEGYLQLALNDKVANIDSKARDFLIKALDSTHHLGQLFQDLLTSAKAEDGRLVNHPSVIEMGAFMSDLAESFKFTADKKGLLTDFIFGTSNSSSEKTIHPLYYVYLDQDRLREVVTNLFDNAVKYTPTGKITIGLTGNREVVQLFVRDTGPGIPAEDLSHLFQKFYRVDNSATRTIGGTGLGLFICKEIIDMYNGRIWAESTLGSGSTFYINLPRISSQQAESLKTSEPQLPAI